MREEPHSGVCDVCGGLVIDALMLSSGRSVRLDAAPVSDGELRAWYGLSHWFARAARDGEAFWGSRRREHVCRVPDRQLELA